MSHWNYRVVRKVHRLGEDREAEEVLSVHEAYYDSKGRVRMITAEGTDPHGETLDELRADTANMLKALDAPVLDYETATDPEATPLGEDA